jgi:hypothetical protein
MEKTNFILSAFGIIFGIALLASLVSGFAVSSSYYAGLQLYPGEERDLYLTLQNMAGNENLTAMATIDEGQEIAKFIDASNTYFILLGTHKKVNIHVKIPESAEIGSKYNLTLSFKTIKESKPGEFGFSSGVGERINVLIVEKPKLVEEVQETPIVQEALPEKKNMHFEILIAAVIVIIGLLITQTMVRIKKLKKKGKRK